MIYLLKSDSYFLFSLKVPLPYPRLDIFPALSRVLLMNSGTLSLPSTILLSTASSLTSSSSSVSSPNQLPMRMPFSSWNPKASRLLSTMTVRSRSRPRMLRFLMYLRPDVM